MAEGSTPTGTGTPSPTDAVRAGHRAGLRRLAPYGIGAAVALAAVMVYSTLAPSRPPLIGQQVDEAIASAIAEVTPAPAHAQLVYQAVQPSLVLIETEGGQAPSGLGSGVVVNIDGDILTSLHVVDGATSIDLTFADGSKSPAEIVAT